MPIQLHIQKMEREADVIKKNEKSANDYLTQTDTKNSLTIPLFYAKVNG
jgi:hypothetical protein